MKTKTSHTSEALMVSVWNGNKSVLISASLCAAAPDLLEAAKIADRNLSELLNTSDDEGRVVAADSVLRIGQNKLRAAIAKAEGK